MVAPWLQRAQRTTDTAQTPSARLAKRLGFSLLALSLVPSVATAAIVETDEAPFSGEVELSYIATSGNSDTGTLNGGIDFVWEQEHFRQRLEIDTLHIERDNDTSAERYYASGQLDYKFDEHQYLFLHTDYERDRFSGYQYVAGVSAGYGHRVFDRDNFVLDAELGPGYRFAKVEDDEDEAFDDQNEVVLRLAGRYRWDLSPTAFFRQELDSTIGNEVTITKATSSVVTSLIQQVSLKFSYNIRHVTDPPPDVRPTDTQFTVGAVYGF